MIRPVDVPVGQGFGENPTSDLPAGHWILKQFGNYQPDGHAGEDYPCPIGTPIRAVTSGKVLHVGFYGGTYRDNPYWIAPNFAGYCYVIDHGSFIGIYAHGKDKGARVKVGETVAEGQVIGLSGNTGGSTGPHLHFEILPDKFVVNGYMYGRIDPATLFAGGLAAMGTTTPTAEEIDVAAEENIMARLAQIVDWQAAQFREVRDNDERNRNMLAGFVRDVVNAKETLTPEQLDAKFTELTAAQEATGPRLYKGDTGPEVYAWDGAAGFRHIGQGEYLTLVTTGATLTELPQDILNKAAGGK